MDVCRKDGRLVGYSFSYPNPADSERWVWKSAVIGIGKQCYQ